MAVMTLSVIMYKRMGISNTDIALYTSWLYLPWVIKPFGALSVDLYTYQAVVDGDDGAFLLASGWVLLHSPCRCRASFRLHWQCPGSWRS